MLTASQLAALAEVAEPASPTSSGTLYLLRVADEIGAALTELGLGLHATCVAGAAETPLIGMSDSEVFAIFVDLGLWDQELPTERAVISVGVRLGAALLARAVVLSAP